MSRFKDGRLITLVVCDRQERVIGQLPSFWVPDPWWQEVATVEARHPNLTVLRVLGGDPQRGGNFGGTVTYLAETANGVSTLGLTPWSGTLTDDPHRMPWARAGGPARDLAWAQSVLARGGCAKTGNPVHHRTWNLSSIWELPSKGPGAWLKSVPPFFGHEAVVLQILQDCAVPRLLATEAHRLLLASMPGKDGYQATTEEQLELVDLLVKLQTRTIAITDQLLAEGVPDARSDTLVAELAHVIARCAPGDQRLHRLLDEAPGRFDEIERCGLPNVLVHGDAHPGNGRIACEPFVWFDWGDSRIGNPLLDLAVLERAPQGLRPVIERHWLEAWCRALPGSNPVRGWKLLRPYAVARMAVVYLTFLDSIEEAERGYHAGDVMPALEAAAEIVSTGGQ